MALSRLGLIKAYRCFAEEWPQTRVVSIRNFPDHVWSQVDAIRASLVCLPDLTGIPDLALGLFTFVE